jgi:hypothetical protein
VREGAGNRAVVEYTAGASERLRRGRLGSLLFPADVKARHDKMAGLVETMPKLHKDLSKAKPPHVWANGRRLTVFGMTRR